jgi:1-phosphofructokinase
MITTLTLNPALDLFLEVKDFDPDDSNRVMSNFREPGGKGVNVSRVIKALGGLTTALGPLGGPEGEEFKKTFAC